MRLAQPISELRKELRDLVTNGQLPEALRYCNESLPENTEKYDLVLQMRANLKQLNREITQNLISQDESGRRIAQISAAFLNLVSNLEEADFEPPQVSKSKSKNDTQHGSVLYHIPHSMPMNKPSYCKVRVAIEEDAILEDIILDADVRIRERVEVSERMSAELVDTAGRVFDILPLNSKDQAIRPTGYTQWLFRVTPLVEGEHQLMVKVSLLAFDQNTKEYVPRDVSVLETVTVVTASQHSDEEEPTFKPTGHSFALGPDAGDGQQPEDTKKVGSSTAPTFSMRTMSFFLAFLVFASSVGFSIAQPLRFDLFVADNITGDYAYVIEKHKDDAPGGLKNPLMEKAYFKKAEKSGELVDLREYQKVYAEQGQFTGEVLQKIATLEWKTVTSIQQKPSLLSIQKYLTDFPDATRLPQVFDAAQAIPAAEQDKVLPQIEQAYVQSMELQPSARKIEQYSQDFPELGKLNTLAEIAAKNDDVLPQAQPVLERVVLQKVKTAENAQQVRALLPSLKIAAQGRPEAEVFQKAGKVATQNDPALGRALQADLRALQAENVATARQEEEKRLAAEKAREDSTRLAEQKASEAKRQKGVEQAKKDQEATDAAEKAKKDQEATDAVDKAEKERLKKEADAKAEQDRKDKEAAAKAANTLTATPDNSIPRPAMVTVKGGTFEMGNVMGDKEYDNEKVHSVTVSDFMIGKTEVTFEEYDRFCAATKKDKPDDEKWGRAKYPVINVSWEDAIAYCNWLSEKHGLQPVYSGQGSSTTANWSANGYRLPTEAEWEYAARGGGKKVRFGNGKDVADPKEINFAASADYKKPYSVAGTYRKQTIPVGSLNSPNALGLQDMSGNVYEWCWDWYGADYYNNSPAKDPKGPSSGTSRVLRGGSWHSDPNNCRAAYRFSVNPTDRFNFYGFRLVRH